MADSRSEPGKALDIAGRLDDLRGEMSEEHERSRALAAVLRDQEERAEAARAVEARRLRRTRIRRSVLVAAWAGMAYIWLAPPSWTKVKPLPQPTMADEARALRVAVFLEAQKIEAYRQERGRLPWVLAETGPAFPGLEYRRKDNRFYELSGTSDRVQLRYDSGTSPLQFVGSAANVLDGASTRLDP